MLTTASHPNNRPERQERILTEGTRADVIAWLAWNDAEGLYTDEARQSEDVEPLTLNQARDIMRAQLQ